MKLSFYCLMFLGFIPPLLGLFDIGFWEIVRLLPVVVGLIWLLRGQRRGRRVPWAAPLISLVYMFIQIQFLFVPGKDYLFLIGLFMTGVALVSVRRELLPFSRLDRRILLGGGLALLVGLGPQLIFGTESAPLSSERWWGGVYLLELPLLYLAISRLLREPQGREREFRLLAVAGGALMLSCFIGIGRISAAFYSSGRAVDDFVVGHYEQAATRIAQLHPRAEGLRFAPLLVEYSIEKMKIRAETVEDWMGLGDIAAQEELWYWAEQAYEKVYQERSSFPSICARLGTALFEQGKVKGGLELMQGGVKQEKAGVEDHLALAAGLARTAAWEEANQVIYEALELGEVREELVRRTYDGKVTGTLEELLPPLFLRYAHKLSLFGVVRLLEDRGWKVLHPAMEIGETGVEAPVNIVAYSGGGSLFAQEQIVIGGRSVSLHKRGYNLAVIEAETGRLDTVCWFDQSHTRATAQFLNGIKEGRIVVLGAHADIATSMTANVNRELMVMGARHLPNLGWSYAFIGVKGGKQGEGIEARSDRSVIIAGVLGANIEDEVIDDPEQLEKAIRQAAKEAPAGIAIFIPSLEPEAQIVAVRR